MSGRLRLQPGDRMTLTVEMTVDVEAVVVSQGEGGTTFQVPTQTHTVRGFTMAYSSEHEAALDLSTHRPAEEPTT